MVSMHVVIFNTRCILYFQAQYVVSLQKIFLSPAHDVLSPAHDVSALHGEQMHAGQVQSILHASLSSNSK
jgi:hypothetical protein